MGVYSSHISRLRVLPLSDIFLSYSKVDLERVRPLVERLEDHGWSVWWDREIPPGQTWPQMIAHGLAATEVMIVVWSEVSVKSEWVEIEATKGKERGGLIPVKIDSVEAPLQFSLIQAADLTAWDSSADNQQLRKVIEELERTLGVPTATAEPVVEQQEIPVEHPVAALEAGRPTSPASKAAKRKQEAETIAKTKRKQQSKEEKARKQKYDSGSAFEGIEKAKIESETSSRPTQPESDASPDKNPRSLLVSVTAALFGGLLGVGFGAGNAVWFGVIYEGQALWLDDFMLIDGIAGVLAGLAAGFDSKAIRDAVIGGFLGGLVGAIVASLGFAVAAGIAWGGAIGFVLGAARQFGMEKETDSGEHGP